MLTLIGIVFGALFVAAALATRYAVSHAEVGYEDESGFHFGRPPEPSRPAKFVTNVRVKHVAIPESSPRATPAKARE
jgi:hypothetical protein